MKNRLHFRRRTPVRFLMRGLMLLTLLMFIGMAGAQPAKADMWNNWWYSPIFAVADVACQCDSYALTVTGAIVLANLI